MFEYKYDPKMSRECLAKDWLLQPKAAQLVKNNLSEEAALWERLDLVLSTSAELGPESVHVAFRIVKEIVKLNTELCIARASTKEEPLLACGLRFVGGADRRSDLITEQGSSFDQEIVIRPQYCKIVNFILDNHPILPKSIGSKGEFVAYLSNGVKDFLSREDFDNRSIEIIDPKNPSQIISVRPVDIIGAIKADNTPEGLRQKYDIARSDEREQRQQPQTAELAAELYEIDLSDIHFLDRAFMVFGPSSETQSFEARKKEAIDGLSRRYEKFPDNELQRGLALFEYLGGGPIVPYRPSTKVYLERVLEEGKIDDPLYRARIYCLTIADHQGRQDPRREALITHSTTLQRLDHLLSLGAPTSIIEDAQKAARQAEVLLSILNDEELQSME